MRKAEVIGRVAGSVDRLKGRVRKFDGGTVAERNIWNEVPVGIIAARGVGTRIQAARAGEVCAAQTVACCSRQALQPGETIDMIAVGMCEQDVADRPAGRRSEDGLRVRFVVRSRVDDGKCAMAHQIGVGAVVGERPRITGGQADNALRKRHRGLRPGASGAVNSGLAA